MPTSILHGEQWRNEGASASDMAALPLWQPHYDELPSLTEDFDSSSGHNVPFSSFFDWKIRSGKQFGDNTRPTAQDLMARFHITALDVNVFDPELFAPQPVPVIPLVSLKSTVLAAGKSTTGHLLLSGRTLGSAVTVHLSSSSAEVLVPGEVTISPASSEVDFNLKTTALSAGVHEISATLDGRTTRIILTVN